MINKIEQVKQFTGTALGVVALSSTFLQIQTTPAVIPFQGQLTTQAGEDVKMRTEAHHRIIAMISIDSVTFSGLDTNCS